MVEYRSFKGRMLLYAVIVTWIFLLAGCGEPLNESDRSTDIPEQGAHNFIEGKEISGDLELQIFVGGYGDEFWKYAIEEFEKVYPKVDVIARMGAKVNEQMTPRWMSDNPPDFAYCDGPGFPAGRLAKEGKMMDLREWFETTKTQDGTGLIKDNIYKDLLTEEYGKIYSAPYIFGTIGMWYDAKFFRENNLAVPSNFEEFLNTASLLKDKKAALMAYPGLYPSYLYEGFFQQGLVVDGGRRLLQDINALKPEAFTSEPFVRNMKKLEQLAKTENAVLGASAGLNHIQTQMEWLNGKVAFIPNGLWLENEMKKYIPADFEMKFMPSLIQDKGRKYAISMYSNTLRLAQKGKNPAAAKAWLAFLYREDIMIKFTELTGVPTACKMDLTNANVSELAKNAQKWIADPNINIIHTLSLEDNLKNLVYNALNSVVYGRSTAIQACEELKREVQNMQSNSEN